MKPRPHMLLNRCDHRTNPGKQKAILATRSLPPIFCAQNYTAIPLPQRGNPLRHAILAGFALAALSLPATAQDLGLEVRSFGSRVNEIIRNSGSDVPLSQPLCSTDGKPSCTMEYGSVQILVDGSVGATSANSVVLRSTLTTPLYQTFEAVEFTMGVLRPELPPLQARRLGMRIFENLIVTGGQVFSDSVDAFVVETSEFEGAVTIVINPMVY